MSADDKARLRGCILISMSCFLLSPCFLSFHEEPSTRAAMILTSACDRESICYHAVHLEAHRAPGAEHVIPSAPQIVSVSYPRCMWGVWGGHFQYKWVGSLRVVCTAGIYGQESETCTYSIYKYSRGSRVQIGPSTLQILPTLSYLDPTLSSKPEVPSLKISTLNPYLHWAI